MGDRTVVHYIVPKIVAPLLEYWSEREFQFDLIQDQGDGTLLFAESEANYGSVRPFERLLQSLAIPYHHQWGAGSEYEPGCGYAHYTLDPQGELEVHVTEWYQSDENVPLEEIEMKLLANDQDLLQEVREKRLRMSFPDNLREFEPNWGQSLRFAVQRGENTAVEWLIDQGTSVEHLVLEGEPVSLDALADSVRARLAEHIAAFEIDNVECAHKHDDRATKRPRMI